MVRAISAFTLALFLSVTATAPADARKHQSRGYDNDGRQVQRTVSARRYTPVRRAAGLRDRSTRGVVIGGRPAGCPVKYCGCSTSLKIFGRIIPELNLAANWLRKFPRTSPAPGMVAARPGHVALLISQVDGDRWKVWDANSGRGLTRIHVRSIRGFAVVNPHASRMALR